MRRRLINLLLAGAAMLGLTPATPTLAAGVSLPHMAIEATQSTVVRIDYRGGRRYHHRRYPAYIYPAPRVYYYPPPRVIYYPPPVAYYPPAVIYNRYAPPVSYYGYYPSYAPYGYDRRYYADW